MSSQELKLNQAFVGLIIQYIVFSLFINILYLTNISRELGRL